MKVIMSGRFSLQNPDIFQTTDESVSFECNRRFKCPDSYCIPWGYACDAKMDCPYGQDEENCTQNRPCTNMFKCRLSMQCLDMEDICDNVPDCKYLDDEDFCDLQQVICPRSCLCHMYAVSCIGVIATFLLCFLLCFYMRDCRTNMNNFSDNTRYY